LPLASMSGMMKMRDSILVGDLGSVTWIRVEGVANHSNCGAIRDYVRQRFEEGGRRFVFDMENCRGIDSTFIGMIYHLAVDVDEKEGEGGVDLINTSDRNANAIRKLGLDWAIGIDRGDERWSNETVLVRENIANSLPEQELSRREKAEMILDAHQILLESNEANESRFRDVVDQLRDELDREDSPGAKED